MIIKAIYTKEWLKLRWYFWGLCLTALGAGSYFWFHLNFAFKSIEPESMMWYRFAQIGDKPYTNLALFFLFSAVVIAVAQFLPETIRNRVRILIHLPCRLQTIAAHHLLAGGSSIFIINGLAGSLIVAVIMRYYPPDVVWVAAKDCFFWTLLGLALYLGLSGAILERDLWRKSLKLLFSLLLGLLYFKNHYTSIDLLLVLVVLWLTLPVYDSFLSVKRQRLHSFLFKISILPLCLLLIMIGVNRYQQEYSRHFEQYYIFFSPILNDFIYQKNGKGHNFIYGTQEQTFDRVTYESNLPFVYWKNLDIQGKLPIQINHESFDKERIRAARQSLQYHPSDLQPKEVGLYPLFNPISNQGVIPFPEEALALKSDRIIVYNCETVKENERLSNEVNQQLLAAGAIFPLRHIWGKTTNMKPFDWGYFVKDDMGKILNLRRANNSISVAPVPTPDNIGSIVHMRITENRLQNFYGYAIDVNSTVYLVSYPDYQFIPLNLQDFDYRSMKFHLLADPLHYLVRYDDETIYRAALFDKHYQLVATTSLPTP
ncbi:protein of unknown function [Desulfuromusa kysingii]|uniref:DUF4857 domain-containing protein n=1 Tax=Desulfuromusa kysingii TaxID=37625 RepID=A0A1H3VVK8_9BACT|nr:DUF4857 domain-containing protein [Desulfuromusa kysingii]SDZ78132.1 protein of unknown function [Desulfuromusa kysingii]